MKVAWMLFPICNFCKSHELEASVNLGVHHWSIRVMQLNCQKVNMKDTANPGNLKLSLWFLSYFIFFTKIGFSTLASIKPSKSFTTKVAINRFLPKERECRTDEEFKLRHLLRDQGYRYSLENCLYDIVIENTMKNCSCFYPVNYLNYSEVKKKSQKLSCADKLVA